MAETIENIRRAAQQAALSVNLLAGHKIKAQNPMLMDNDHNASSPNGTDLSLQSSSSNSLSAEVDDSRDRDGSFESHASTGISSMCSSIAEEMTDNRNSVASASKKRLANGSLKQSLEHQIPNAIARAQPHIPFEAHALQTQSPLKIPKKRGRPPKARLSAEQPGIKLSRTPKTPKLPKSQFAHVQVRPRSSIPALLPADVLAGQCIAAAYDSRLDPYALHTGEDRLLHGLLSPKDVTVYLNIRNRILRLWKQNSLCSVTADEAFGCAKENRFFGLADVAYKWLVRNGYINFGCVEVPYMAEMPQALNEDIRQRTVVVVGAGVSGLTSARQLEGLFAHEAGRWAVRGERPPRVIVLEGRKRIGGRVYSKPLRSQVTNSLPNDLRNTAEMGAMIVTGFERGNPLDTIIRAQLGLRYHLMRDSLTIYDCNGRPVDEQRDMRNTELYTDISDRAGEYRALPQKQETRRGDEDLINRGRDPAHDGFAAAQLEPLSAAHLKAHVPSARRGRRRANAPPGTEKLTGRSQVIEGDSARLSASRAAKSMGWQMKDGVAKNQSISLHATARACSHPTLGSVMDEAIRQYDDLIELSPMDMQLLNWHHANLEYANAAPVTALSLSGHDQDTGNEFEGAHSEVIGGYTQVPRGLMNLPKKLDVRFDHIVDSIHYDDRHPSNGPTSTKVVCTNGTVFEADEVVLTVPLGVLKADTIDFDPPLPSWKQGPIDRMGFGLLNKVILLYDEPFWDDSRDMFGLLNEAEVKDSLNPAHYETRRGRFYLFWNASKTSGRPMLIALMAGHAAYEAECTNTETLMKEATERLRTCFGQKVQLPLEVMVTRWKSDKFTRGTYSYVAPETQPGDYDVMAKSVGNLHFAGEATCGTHPATVHGALLSGLRVASGVVEAMLGPIEKSDPIVAPGPIKREAALSALVTPTSVSNAVANSVQGTDIAIISYTSSGSASKSTTTPAAPTQTVPEIKQEPGLESEESLHGLPPTKVPRARFVMQPAGPPPQSVCASDPSFWVSASLAGDTANLNYEAAVVASIISKIGDRPRKPQRPGVNPFLLFTKDKWEECKVSCSSNSSTAGAGRDAIRQTLGKWWKAADAVSKQPYQAQSQIAQEQADALRKEWEVAIAKWDADALQIRREHAIEHAQSTNAMQAAEGNPSGMSKRKTNVSNNVVLDHF